jgi:hypothetical protein
MADGDVGGARDDPDAPIFPGRPTPRTAIALFEECEEALRLVDSRAIERRAAAGLFNRWQGAMRAIDDAEPEPYPEWLRHDLPAYMQQSSMWTPVSSMNLEQLRQSIAGVRNWSKARTPPPNVQDGGGPGAITEPFYARPDEAGVRAALESAFRVFQCIAPKSWVDAPALVAFVMGNHGKITTAEAMWAIHDIAMSGGLIVHVNEQMPLSLNLVTLINPPAGIQMASGVLHVDLEEPAWSGLDFEPVHRKIEEFRRSLLSESANIENSPKMPSSAETHQRLFPKGIPENADIRDLVLQINEQRGNGKSLGRIARELTGEDRRKDKKAKSLLAQVRRLKREGRVNL